MCHLCPSMKQAFLSLILLMFQSDIRTLSINHWGSKTGLEVLRLLSKLYLNLVWESTVLLALCSGEYQPDLDGFGRSDLDKLIPPSDSKVSLCHFLKILTVTYKLRAVE